MAWPLWVFALGQLLLMALVEVRLHGPIPVMALYAALTLGWLYLLLRGVRWIWLVTIGVFVLGFAVEAVSRSLQWRGIVISLAGLMLLLLPVTRRYFSKDQTPTAVESTVPSPLRRFQKAAEPRLRRWTPGVSDRPDLPIINGFVVFYLGLVLAVLAFVAGEVTRWHEGAGHGSVLVDALWHMVSDIYTLLQLLFLVLLCVWAYRRLRKAKAA